MKTFSSSVHIAFLHPSKSIYHPYLILFSVSKKIFYHFTAYKGRALKENPDKIFYLAWDLLPKDNPEFHHKIFYSFEQVQGENKLRTPQINNITLKVCNEL